MKKITSKSEFVAVFQKELERRKKAEEAQRKKLAEIEKKRKLTLIEKGF